MFRSQAEDWKWLCKEEKEPMGGHMGGILRLPGCLHEGESVPCRIQELRQRGSRPPDLRSLKEQREHHSGENVKFTHRLNITTEEAPGQFPIYLHARGLHGDPVASPVGEWGLSKTPSWNRQCHHQEGDSRRVPRVAPPPGQEPSESSGSSLSPTSVGSGQLQP